MIAVRPRTAGGRLTVAEAALLMRCSEVTVRRMIASGQLSAARLAGKWLIAPSALPTAIKRAAESAALNEPTETERERLDRQERLRRRRETNRFIRELGGTPLTREQREALAQCKEALHEQDGAPGPSLRGEAARGVRPQLSTHHALATAG